MTDPISATYFALDSWLGLGFGYLLGSIPFGLLLTRLAGLGDIRTIGSGNIGATNVLRTGRKDIAALTLLLDGGKGAVAVIIAGLYGKNPEMAAALGAVLGHLFPLWLRFKGGKGVATTLGVMLALVPFAGVIACLIWAAMAKWMRISSLAALTAFACAPFVTLLFYAPHMAWLVGTLSLCVFAKHHANIKRLLTGKEPKIGT